MRIATFLAVFVVLVCVVNIANATYGDNDDGDWGGYWGNYGGLVNYGPWRNWGGYGRPWGGYRRHRWWPYYYKGLYNLFGHGRDDSGKSSTIAFLTRKGHNCTISAQVFLSPLYFLPMSR